MQLTFEQVEQCGIAKPQLHPDIRKSVNIPKVIRTRIGTDSTEVPKPLKTVNLNQQLDYKKLQPMQEYQYYLDIPSKLRAL